MMLTTTRLLSTLLFSASLISSASATVTCGISDNVNFFLNPSFETGDLTDWTSLSPYGSIDYGTVASGDASDVDDYFVIPSNDQYEYLMQELTGLEIGETYTLSVDYKLVWTTATEPTSSANLCNMAFSQHSWSSLISGIKTSYSSADAEWTTYSINWSPTASTVNLYFIFGCIENTSIRLDNFKAVGPGEVCTTSTPTPTPTPNSVPSSSPVKSSSVAVHSSSSVRPVQVRPSSKALISPSSKALPSSTPVPSSVRPSASAPAGHSRVPHSVRPVPSAPTTYLTTETVVVGTTVCPITEGAQPTATTTLTGQGSITVPMTTSTAFITRTSTITACPSSVKDCPASEKSTYVTTETIVDYTTICPVTAAEATQTAISTASVYIEASATGSSGSTGTGSTGSSGTIPTGSDSNGSGSNGSGSNGSGSNGSGSTTISGSIGSGSTSSGFTGTDSIGAGSGSESSSNGQISTTIIYSTKVESGTTETIAIATGAVTLTVAKATSAGLVGVGANEVPPVHRTHIHVKPTPSTFTTSSYSTTQKSSGVGSGSSLTTSSAAPVYTGAASPSFTFSTSLISALAFLVLRLV
ncbi:uncharacterized protein N7484_009506 [Penicillium longicatenatum]|uniref:uncharacterized protein n=1 Tax=Penicillium longicatenatum TaxID=1561947 RepID=UPI002547CDB7|nr:uncharacterized protein N7484_009506 [Penicillium longicatenatum]KAJ5636193.1 hypothetical protein N7484_009506 [Penicillium longicatenatum]